MMLAAAAVTAIMVNGLFLQHGPHPAPIFPIKPLPVAGNDATSAIKVPRPRPADPDSSRRESTRPRAEIANDIQRELARRGYYDGVIDGVYGAKTDAAIRDFEQATGLKPSSELNESLLAAIVRAPARPQATQSTAAPRKDPIAELIVQRPPSPLPPTPPQQPTVQQASPQQAPLQHSPSQQVSRQQASPQSSAQILAVQRALSDFGYGQIKPTGVYDADTRLAIQHFERDRRLPITGEASERVRRELAALTGRPLD